MKTQDAVRKYNVTDSTESQFVQFNSNEVDISFGREQIDLFTFLLLFLYF